MRVQKTSAVAVSGWASWDETASTTVIAELVAYLRSCVALLSTHNTEKQRKKELTDCKLLIKPVSEVPCEVREYFHFTILKLVLKTPESDDSQREALCGSSIMFQESFSSSSAVHKFVSLHQTCSELGM